MNGPSRIFPCLAALLASASLAACGATSKPLALTLVDTERMDVVRVAPGEDPLGDEEDYIETVSSFAFEPHWNPQRTRIAFTRINVSGEGRRVLSIYLVEEGRIIDVAMMSRADWTGYGFAPAWSPEGRALAFKLRGGKSNGVYALTLADQKTNRLLPDAGGEIDELEWTARGLFFTVRAAGAQSPVRGLRWVELPPISDLVTVDALSVARDTVDMGLGTQPRFYDGALYYLRPDAEGAGEFDLVRDELVGAEPEVVLSGVGPYFEIGPDGTIAYQTDPAGGTRLVRLALLRPGASKGEVTRISAFRFRFSPDGKKLACLWLIGGKPGYFIYNHKDRTIRPLTNLRGEFSSDALASLVSRPLFDW